MKVKCHTNAWDTPGEEDDVCGRFFEQVTIRFHDLSSSLAHPRWSKVYGNLRFTMETFVWASIFKLTFVFLKIKINQVLNLVCVLPISKPFCLFSVRVQEYNATIECYWAPLLLESISDDTVIHRVSNRIIRKGAHYKTSMANIGNGVDMLVFNTYIWWMSGLKMRVLWVIHTCLLQKLKLLKNRFNMHI